MSYSGGCRMSSSLARKHRYPVLDTEEADKEQSAAVGELPDAIGGRKPERLGAPLADPSNIPLVNKCRVQESGTNKVLGMTYGDESEVKNNISPPSKDSAAKPEARRRIFQHTITSHDALMFAPLLFMLGVIFAQTIAEPVQTRVNGVSLDDARVVGLSTGVVTKFLGIPFAKPPTGDRRFRLPERIDRYSGTITATKFGPSCPQQAIQVPLPPRFPPVDGVVDQLLKKVYNVAVPSDEDCLTINIITPSSATPQSNFPVVVWIYGGGFEIGGTSLYDGTLIVEKSIKLGEPVIYVSMNYRLHAFGFLPGRQVKEAGVGNLGLHDQREALRWIQKYITNFGGDPSKVTIWGESAGAISVGLQMVANNGDAQGLFRGAFMQSGSPFGFGDLSDPYGQGLYDFIVAETGCSSASDTLACLRTVPYQTIQQAVDKTPSLSGYQGLSLAWIPRVDGKLFSDSPQKQVQQGKVANIPFVTGDCNDEGTLFSLASLNVTSTDQAKQWIQQFWLPNASSADIDKIVSLYSNNATALDDAPPGTGLLNLVSSQFQRISTFSGDAIFQAPRRSFLRQRSGAQNTWSYLSKRLKRTPILGAFHLTDLLNSYGGGELTDYLVHFANNLDPNGGDVAHWPRYTTASPSLMTFQGNPRVSITQDTYREEGMDFLIDLTTNDPLLP